MNSFRRERQREAGHGGRPVGVTIDLTGKTSAKIARDAICFRLG